MTEIRWHGNNTGAINKALELHAARAEPDGCNLHLVGIGLNTHIEVGDTLIVDGDQLGIRRAKTKPKADQYVTWEGSNLMEIDDFLKLYGVRLEMHGFHLSVYANEQAIAVLGRGDRITKAADGNIVVSRAGQHHRV